YSCSSDSLQKPIHFHVGATILRHFCRYKSMEILNAILDALEAVRQAAVCVSLPSRANSMPSVQRLMIASYCLALSSTSTKTQIACNLINALLVELYTCSNNVRAARRCPEAINSTAFL